MNLIYVFVKTSVYTVVTMFSKAGSEVGIFVVSSFNI